MATDSAGYWPLSYHGGSVWAHDTAIAISGLVRAGLADRASALVEGLLRAAERFEYRMPELHSGDAASGRDEPGSGALGSGGSGAGPSNSGGSGAGPSNSGGSGAGPSSSGGSGAGPSSSGGSGEGASETGTSGTTVPAPYPAACRPQAWSAAAAVAVMAAQLGLRPDGDGLLASPAPRAGRILVRGLRVGAREFEVRAGDGGASEVRSR
jgi:glycogen debranching enzyme